MQDDPGSSPAWHYISLEPADDNSAWRMLVLLDLECGGCCPFGMPCAFAAVHPDASKHPLTACIHYAWANVQA